MEVAKRLGDDRALSEGTSRTCASRRTVRDDASMAERLHRLLVPEGQQTVRIEFPSGQTFRLGMREGDVVRFAVETDRDVRMVEFYGRGGNAIVGLQITSDISEQTADESEQ